MSLPRVDRLGVAQQLLAAGAIGAACALWLANAISVARHVDSFEWWMPLVFVAGMATADFLSGLVHWSADTWGRDDLKFIGQRLLVPFRVHHVNPQDFLTRPFLDTNGEVAMLAVPALLASRLIPLESDSGLALAIAMLGLAGVGAATNQIHQWAHMPSPPPVARWLQGWLILGYSAHARHHGSPYDASYCITTGWCNPALDRLQFFRRIERLITVLSGVEPRQDDGRYRMRLDATQRDSMIEAAGNAP